MPLVRIRFEIPGHTGPLFYRRDGDIIVIRGEQVHRPELTPDPQQAHRFAPESAIAFRDHWRRMYQGQPFTITVENLDGTGPLYEQDESPSDSEDQRKPIWFVADENIISGTPIALMLGYVIRPGRRPSGRCWCLRACDVPSMANHTAFETIYGATPDEVVERAKQAWGTLLQPANHPNKDTIELELANRRLEDVRRPQIPGRLRPGDF